MPPDVTIGRVNIYDPNSLPGSGVEVFYEVTVYVSACPWDLNDDGDVGVPDLLILLEFWGNPYDVPELLALLADWGPCP